jgi:hypothetical protein
LVGHVVEEFKPLLQRVDPIKIAAMIEAGKA